MADNTPIFGWTHTTSDINLPSLRAKLRGSLHFEMVVWIVHTIWHNSPEKCVTFKSFRRITCRSRSLESHGNLSHSNTTHWSHCTRVTDIGRNGTTPPHHTTTVLQPFFWDHPGEPVPEENFWTLWCKGRLTEADTLTMRLGATPSGLTSAHLHHPPIFLRTGCPSCQRTNSVKALKATSAFGLRRRRQSSPQRCYLHHLRTLLVRMARDKNCSDSRVTAGCSQP